MWHYVPTLLLLSLCMRLPWGTAGYQDAICSELRDEFVHRSPGETSADDGNTTMLIPKLIHQHWDSALEVPAKFRELMHSWLELHPGWCYMFWDNADQAELVRRHYPNFAGVFFNLSNIEQADFSRLLYLYRFGGLYVDLDFKCLKPFDELRHLEGFLGSEPALHARFFSDPPSDTLVNNGLMASIPGLPFWMQFAHHLRPRLKKHKKHIPPPWKTTGPVAMQAYMQSLGANWTGMTRFPEEYFFPEINKETRPFFEEQCAKEPHKGSKECEYFRAYGETGLYTNNTYACHYWSCSYCGGNRSLDVGFDIAELVPARRLIRPTLHGWL